MSSILEAITSELGPGTLASIGGAVGATPEQTKSVFAAALPALVGGLASNASQPDGAAALAQALDRDHGPNLMDSLGPMAGALLGGGGGAGGLAALAGSLLGGGGGAPTGGLGSLLGALASAGGSGAPKALNGAGILGHIFGGAPNAQSAAGSVASASGVDVGTVMKLLPVLAPIVMSALGTLKQKHALDANGVASLLQGEASALQAPTPTDNGFGVDDLMKIGAGLAGSGALARLFT